MTVITGTLTLNPAFLREIKQENQRLCDLLCAVRGLIDSPPVLRNHTRRLVDLLEALSDQLALHFSLEEAYGYFEDAIHVAPRLSERAEALRDDHAKLFDAIRVLADLAREAHLRQQLPQCMTEIVARFQEFDYALARHDAAESELMVESAHLDIGVGD